MQWIKKEKKCKMELILYEGMYVAILVDMIVGYSGYYSGICFKVVYVLALVLFLFYGAKRCTKTQYNKHF